MTLLSDKDLIQIIKEQDVVNPLVMENCKGATYNLTLDPIIKRYVSKEPITLGKEVTEDHYETIDLAKDDFMISPAESVIIKTHEFVKIPNNYAANIFERYSIKSLGLMISPAHYMNPGYRGNISLVAVNHSPVPIRLVHGIKICQLSLNELSSTPENPYSKQDAKYMDAESVSISKLHLDQEVQGFLQERGIKRVPDGMAKELGDHLMDKVKSSARRLADILREEENGK